eukprot:PhM_4_TR3074/c1_g2_i9/m.102413
MLLHQRTKFGVLVLVVSLFIGGFNSLTTHFKGKHRSDPIKHQEDQAAIDGIVNWSYTEPVYTVANFGFIRRRPIRIDSNLSRDLEHTCEATPCPYARPVDVMGMDDPWRRTARMCTGQDMYREARPGTWYYDGELPRGVAAAAAGTTQFVMDRPILYVPSSGCRVRRLQPSALRKCLRQHKGTLLFVGDSHLRDILQEVLTSAGWPDLATTVYQKHTHHNVFHRAGGVTIIYNNYIVRDDPPPLAQITNVVHLFVTLGVWGIAESLKTLDQWYVAYYQRLKRFVLFALKGRSGNTDPTLPPLKVTYMAIRHMYEVTDRTEDHDWTLWLWTLSQTGDRVAVHRKLQLCVVRRVMRELGVAYDVIDFRRSMTNTTLARALILPDGHHHRQRHVMNRAMADVFVHRLCHGDDWRGTRRGAECVRRRRCVRHPSSVPSRHAARALFAARATTNGPSLGPASPSLPRSERLQTLSVQPPKPRAEFSARWPPLRGDRR